MRITVQNTEFKGIEFILRDFKQHHKPKLIVEAIGTNCLCDQFKAGIHYTTFAQIFAPIFSLEKLMLVAQSQSLQILGSQNQQISQKIAKFMKCTDFNFFSSELDSILWRPVFATE